MWQSVAEGGQASRHGVYRNAPRQSSAAPRRPPREPLAPVHAPVEGARKVRQGIVVSDKADKTITVRIDVARRHRRYEKIVRSSSTLHAHDENNEAHEGDVVRVIESRPLSRTKRWKLVDVLEQCAMIQNETQAAGSRQHRRARDPLHPRQGRIAPALCVCRRRHHRHRQAGQPPWSRSKRAMW